MSGPRVLLVGAGILVASVAATAPSVLAAATILLSVSGPRFAAAALLGTLVGILPEAMVVTGACGIVCAATLLVRTNLLARPGRGTGRE